MIQIKQAIVVEGKYDKIKLESLIDGVVLQTDGFRIFKDKEKCQMLRTLADTTGLIVLTDSDVAGFKIRNFIRSVTHNSPNVIDLYIPQIPGKEKRKVSPGKEGILGVEGMDKAVLEALLSNSQIQSKQTDAHRTPITKMDLFQDGLSGRDNSSHLRQQLLKKLNLPNYLSCNAMLPILNALMSLEEYRQLVCELSLPTDPNHR